MALAPFSSYIHAQNTKELIVFEDPGDLRCVDRSAPASHALSLTVHAPCTLHGTGCRRTGADGSGGRRSGILVSVLAHPAGLLLAALSQNVGTWQREPGGPRTHHTLSISTAGTSHAVDELHTLAPTTSPMRPSFRHSSTIKHPKGMHKWSTSPNDLPAFMQVGRRCHLRSGHASEEDA